MGIVASARTAVTLVAIVGVLAVLAGVWVRRVVGGARPSGAPAVPATLLKPVPVPRGENCVPVVLDTLGRVLQRIYNEGVKSEEVWAARGLIRRDQALHGAVEDGDAGAARAAAARLLATKHMTDLTIERDGRVLADSGEPAIGPVQGNLTDARGKVIGDYLTALFSDRTFESEAKGLTESQIAVRQGGRVLAGSTALGGRELHGIGELTAAGVRYGYVAFPVRAYPSGTATVEMLRRSRSLMGLCGPTREATVARTVQAVAGVIYRASQVPGPPYRSAVCRPTRRC